MVTGIVWFGGLSLCLVVHITATGHHEVMEMGMELNIGQSWVGRAGQG